jgi:hypothetical protein
MVVVPHRCWVPPPSLYQHILQFEYTNHVPFISRRSPPRSTPRPHHEGSLSHANDSDAGAVLNGPFQICEWYIKRAARQTPSTMLDYLRGRSRAEGPKALLGDFTVTRSSLSIEAPKPEGYSIIADVIDSAKERITSRTTGRQNRV